MEETVRRYVAGPVEATAIGVGEVTLDVHLEPAPGRDDAEVVLLVSGLGRQRTHWPPQLLAGLRAAGLSTLTVDNRDAGRSTVLDQASPADGAAYGIGDLAADHLGILDHLGIGRAHVLGMSMGGMIAQHLAFSWPDRVASLTSLMSNTGGRDTGQASGEVQWVLGTPEPAEPAAFVEHQVRVGQAIGSPGAVDGQAERARADVAAGRGIHPDGTIRQLLAILADRDRTSRLAGVGAPTLVVHGTADPLIDASGGRATAEAIPGARLHLIEGMGHDLPLAHLPELVGAVVGHVLDVRSD